MMNNHSTKSDILRFWGQFFFVALLIFVTLQPSNVLAQSSEFQVSPTIPVAQWAKSTGWVSPPVLPLANYSLSNNFAQPIVHWNRPNFVSIPTQLSSSYISYDQSNLLTINKELSTIEQQLKLAQLSQNFAIMQMDQQIKLAPLAQQIRATEVNYEFQIVQSAHQIALVQLGQQIDQSRLLLSQEEYRSHLIQLLGVSTTLNWRQPPPMPLLPRRLDTELYLPPPGSVWLVTDQQRSDTNPGFRLPSMQQIGSTWYQFATSDKSPARIERAILFELVSLQYPLGKFALNVTPEISQFFGAALSESAYPPVINEKGIAVCRAVVCSLAGMSVPFPYSLAASETARVGFNNFYNVTTNNPELGQIERQIMGYGNSSLPVNFYATLYSNDQTLQIPIHPYGSSSLPVNFYATLYSNDQTLQIPITPYRNGFITSYFNNPQINTFPTILTQPIFQNIPFYNSPIIQQPIIQQPIIQQPIIQQPIIQQPIIQQPIIQQPIIQQPIIQPDTWP